MFPSEALKATWSEIRARVDVDCLLNESTYPNTTATGWAWRIQLGDQNEVAMASNCSATSVGKLQRLTAVEGELHNHFLAVESFMDFRNRKKLNFNGFD